MGQIRRRCSLVVLPRHSLGTFPSLDGRTDGRTVFLAFFTYHLRVAILETTPIRLKFDVDPICRVEVYFFRIESVCPAMSGFS